MREAGREGGGVGKDEREEKKESGGGKSIINTDNLPLHVPLAVVSG